MTQITKHQIDQVQRQMAEIIAILMSPPKYTLAQLRNLKKAA